MNSPEITVFMPVYNAEKFLRQAIQSVLRQTFKDFELLIINDGSTDKSAEIIRTFSDPRIRFIDNKINTGLVAVRNLGVKESRGRYLALLDADDIALPDRLKKQKEFLDSNNDFGLIGSAVALIDENGIKTGVIWRNYFSAEELPVALVFHNRLAQSSVMVRKNILPETPYREGFAPAEDYDLWIRLAKITRLWNLPEILTLYRVHKSGQNVVRRQNQIAAIGRIMLGELTRLGLKPSAEELALHKKTYFDSENITEFLTQKETWFRKLIAANGAAKVF